ncbi:MAG: DoxX family protein [Pacificimonas sp.]
MTETRREGIRWALSALLALVYFLAGLAHIRSPEGFLAITPGWVPFPETVIFGTGVAEIAGAIGLFIPRLRQAAGIGLALYAVCVYPANIKHAIEGVAIGGAALGWGYHLPRLLFQPVFVWWALFAGRVLDWPFGRVRQDAVL